MKFWKTYTWDWKKRKDICTSIQHCFGGSSWFLPLKRRNRIVLLTESVQFNSVAQSCLTLCDPTDCSPPGSSVHGDSPGKNIGVGCHALLHGIVPSQESNQGLLRCRRILYQLSCLYLLTWRQTYHPPIHPSKFPSLTDSFLVDVLRNPSSLCCQPRTQFLTKKRSPKKRNRSGFSHVFSCQHSERALVKEETPHSRTGPGLSVWPESNHLKSWNSRKPSFLRVRREHLHNSTLDVPAQPECFINSN